MDGSTGSPTAGDELELGVTSVAHGGVFVGRLDPVKGVDTLIKAFRQLEPHVKDPQYTAPLATVGGFLDAAGGGGWGPVVTSNLLVQGSDPRKTIGTVKSAEFLITSSISIAVIASIGMAAFTTATVGLIIGGVVAAPLGALMTKRVPVRPLLGMVAVVLIATSMFSIYKALPIF